MSKVLKFLAWLILAIAVLLGGLILYATLSDYEPDEVISMEIKGIPDVMISDFQIDVMIWNIGYCGLDASMDFFYDGGKQVRPPETNVQENLAEVLRFLKSNDSIEFFLLQEVDIDSRRSYRINQYNSIQSLKQAYHSFSGLNYDVFFVPLPFSNPMGKVESGLQTLTRYMPSGVTRHSFPGNYAWPKNLFMLDRCFLVSRHPLGNGKELLVINTHNSAYDDGSLRKMQMEYLRDFLKEEYSLGNYIIVGGDWNQSPPGFPKQFEEQVFDDQDYSEIPADFLPADWQWVWNGKYPTNRRVATVYEKGETPTALIDFFLVSPNLTVYDIKTIDLDFRHSDHQPVILRVGLGH
jgi:endonuclease/exonuclease/phosphatase family metal-dependent hydrolase